MTLPQVQDMMKKFRAADSNSDGELDHEEFAKAMNIDPTTPYAKKLFDHLDQVGDCVVVVVVVVLLLLLWDLLI